MKKVLFFAIAGLLALTSCTQKAEKTIANLKEGIKGETTASAKYAAFAQKATEEGHVEIAKLFMAASKAEAIHAKNHTNALKNIGQKMEAFTPVFEVKSTAENLKAAIDGETYENTTMYPKFIKDAESEKAANAVKSFTWANDTEKKHQEFYKKALEALNAKTETTLPISYAVCPICGNTYDAKAVDPKCAFCQTDKAKFIIV